MLQSRASAYGKSVTVNDFRGRISISPVISKVFEHCILDRYNNLFTCSDNQFGFKNSLGVLKLFYIFRCVVDRYVSSDPTVNVCALLMYRMYSIK